MVLSVPLERSRGLPSFLSFSVRIRKRWRAGVSAWALIFLVTLESASVTLVLVNPGETDCQSDLSNHSSKRAESSAVGGNRLENG